MNDDDPKEVHVLRPETRPRPRPTPPPGPDLETLFREHHGPVFRAAYRITGNAMDAEDVLQTVFLRLARQELAIVAGGNPGGYLYRAAVNAALDVVRARTRAGKVPLEEAEPAAATADPQRELESRELRVRLRQALATLRPRAAETFALRYFEGLGNGEIATLLGTSQGVVAVTLHRIRARLRKELPLLLETRHEA